MTESSPPQPFDLRLRQAYVGNLEILGAYEQKPIVDGRVSHHNHSAASIDMPLSFRHGSFL